MITFILAILCMLYFGTLWSQRLLKRRPATHIYHPADLAHVREAAHIN